MRLRCGNYRTVGMPNVGANIGGGGGGDYLKWPIREGSAQKKYLFHASGVEKGREFCHFFFVILKRRKRVE